jgi:hypothetical protein
VKVWIVFDSDYEQSFPVAVFSSEEAAEAYAAKKNEGYQGGAYAEVLEPYELDQP